jgi:parallel beta-helix repeat protein
VHFTWHLKHIWGLRQILIYNFKLNILLKRRAVNMFLQKRAFRAVLMVLIIFSSSLIYLSTYNETTKNASGEEIEVVGTVGEEYKTIGGINYINGNWIVNTTENYEDSQFVLTGNLVIKSGGVLTFRNTTLYINSTLLNNPHGIKVKNGGIFQIWDSDNNNQTSDDRSKILDSPYDKDDLSDLDYRYFFRVESGGKVDINNSYIEECGFYDIGSDMDSWGLHIESDDNKIKNTTFHKCGRAVILLNAKNNLIERINGSELDTIIEGHNANNTIIRDCYINGNDIRYGISFYDSEQLSFYNNYIVTKFSNLYFNNVNSSNFVNNFIMYTQVSSLYRGAEFWYSNNVNIDNLQGAFSHRGIDIKYCSNVTVINSLFETQHIDSVYYYLSYYAISATECEDFIIENCTFFNFSGRALEFTWMDQLKILNSTFNELNREAAWIIYSNLFIDNCIFNNNSKSVSATYGNFYFSVITGQISNCSMNFSHSRDLYIRSSKNLRIINNQIGGDPSCGEGILLYNVDNSYIANNKIYYQFSKLISLTDGCQNNIFYNNTLIGRDGADWGFYMSNADSNVILKHKFYDLNYAIYDNRYSTIKDCEVISCNYGIVGDGSIIENISFKDNSYSLGTSDSDQTIAKNCTITNSVTYDIFVWTPGNLVVINCSFNEAKILLSSSNPKLFIGWWVEIFVQDTKGPVPGALVSVRNESGFLESSGYVGDDGHVILPVIEELRTRIGGINTIFDWNPHNISAFLWPDTAYVEPEPTITTNSNLTITFNVNTRPAPPQKLKAETSDNDISLSWEFPAMGDLSYFEVFRSIDPTSFNYNTPISTPSAASRTWIDVDAADDWTTFYYQIRAVDGGNQKGNVSNTAMNGDWVIASGVNDQYSGLDVLLNGSLTVLNGGILTLKGSKILFNTSYHGEFGVLVYSGGMLKVTDIDNDPDTSIDCSNITSQDMSYPIYFIAEKNAILRISNSIIFGVGYRKGLSGLYIYNHWGLSIEGTGSIIENNIFVSTTESSYGLLIDKTDGLIIRNNTFKPFDDGLGYSNAIWGHGVMKCVIDNNSIIGTQSYAIYLSDFGGNNTISNNTVSFCPYGINNRYGINDKILFNSVFNITYIAVHVYGCSNTFIHGNLIYNNSNTKSSSCYGLYLRSTLDSIIDNNIFFNNIYSIYITSDQNSTFGSNTISNLDGTGVYCKGSENTKFYNTTITNCTKDGMYFYGSGYGNENSGIILESCNISNCLYGIKIIEGFDFEIHNIDLRNNLYGIYIEYSARIHIKRSKIANNPGIGIFVNGIAINQQVSAVFENTTHSNPSGKEFKLDDSAIVWMVNVSLTYNDIMFNDGLSKIAFFWYTHIFIEDIYGSPAVGAQVKISKVGGEFTTGTTDSSGYLHWRLVHDITNLRDGNFTSNPYTITATLGNHSGTNITSIKGPMIIKVDLDNQPPSVVGSKITPSNPYTNDDLVLTFGYSDPEGDPEYPHMVKWYKNSVHQTSLDNLTAVDSTKTKKGERWDAYVWVNDGATYSELNPYNIPTVTILNSLPIVTDVTISPSNPSSTTDISVSYLYSDLDADSESVIDTDIKWWVDHGQGAGFVDSGFTGPTLSWEYTEKGDQWKVVVQPHDGESEGDKVESNTLTIGNSGPEISSLIIIPESLTSLDDLTISYEFFDIDDDPEAAGTYKWLVDRGDGSGFIDSGITSAVVSSTSTRKGEIWYCEFTPYDGFTYGSKYVTEEITIGNTPPALSGVVIVTPSEPASNEDLKVVYTYDDHDGDPEGSTSFEWYVDEGDGFINRNIKGFEVHSSKLDKDSRWFCKVTPHDGETFGKPVNSSIVTIRNSPPSVSDLEIKPEDPIGGEELGADYDYFDIDGDAETGTKIRWYRDNIQLSEFNDLRTIPENITRKDEVWYFSVQPFDGGDYGPTHQSPLTKISNNVTIGNSKPNVGNVSILPKRPTNSDTLVANYEFYDADNDSISAVEIKWYRNNVFTGITGLEVIKELTRRDDIWYFELRIFDGSDWSEWKTSPPNTIYNIPPELFVTPDPGNYTIFENEVFEFSKVATDPDGDTLGFLWYVNDDVESDRDSFTLVTTYDSEPMYNVRLEVSDGTVTIVRHWNITVINKDRAPYFEKKDPEISDPKIMTGEPFDFSVDVNDDDIEDHDKLIVTWYLDSEQVGTGPKYTYTPKDYEVGDREIKAIVSDGELNTTTTWNVTVEKVEDESEEFLGYSYDFLGLVFAIISGAAAIIVFVFGVIRLRKKKGKLQEYMEKIEEITESDKWAKGKEKELLELKSQIKKEFTKELITENHYLILERELDNALGSTRKTIIGGKVALTEKVREDVDGILDDGVVTKREYRALMMKLSSSKDVTPEEKKQLKAQMARWLKENKESDLDEEEN